MIYLVEDDVGIRELVVYTLGNTGFEAKGFEDAAAFFDALAKEKPALVLLDIMLPGKDGISILKDLKALCPEIPVIMLTAKSTEFDKVKGLDLGADDYITKPFGMMELLSRIKAVLRRSAKEPKAQLCVGGVVIDLKKHAVLCDGKNIELTHKEFELLRILAERQGEVVFREELLQLVWGYDYEGESRTLDVHIRTLRGKLGAAGDQIVTVRSVGYRMGE